MQKLLIQYHQQLIQLQNKIFSNNSNNRESDNNIFNEGKTNNIDNNINDKSLTLNSL